MYKLFLAFLLSTGLAFSANLYSLPDTLETEPDTIETEDNWDDWENWDEEVNRRWEEKFDMFEFSGAPTIAANFGLYKMDHNDLNGSFAEPRAFQLKLGYTEVDKIWQSSYLLSTNFRYLSASNITTDLADISESDSAYETNNWKISLGRSSGYGYEFGPSAIFLTSGTSLDWTRLHMTETLFDSADKNITGLFNNTFRFGTSFEAGIRFQIFRQLSIEANYERSAVFSRHLFWKWLGSTVIEAGSQALIDKFIEEILDSSPYFAPVMGFLLKNGLSYGLYELRKEKMNWPFNSAPPLTHDQFKFGVTFVF